MSEIGQELLQKKREQVETLRARKREEEARAEAEAKRKEELALKAKRKQLLQKLGYSVYPKKEYAPEGTGWREARDAGFDRQEPINGVARYYRLTENMPDITDEEYAELEALDQEAESMKASSVRPAPVAAKAPAGPAGQETIAMPVPSKEAYSARAEVTNYDSFAEGFMRVLAYIVWVGGIVASLAIWITLKTGFWLFLAYLSAFFMAGALWFCMAELFGNIAAIRSQLWGYTIKRQ